MLKQNCKFDVNKNFSTTTWATLYRLTGDGRGWFYKICREWLVHFVDNEYWICLQFGGAYNPILRPIAILGPRGAYPAWGDRAVLACGVIKEEDVILDHK